MDALIELGEKLFRRKERKAGSFGYGWSKAAKNTRGSGDCILRQTRKQSASCAIIWRGNIARGTLPFVLLSVTRSPKDCKELAYTADRIARRAPFASEFVAVTDVALQQPNERHRFVGDTLREAGIEAVPMEGSRCG